jgi:hypothetical protein
LLTNIISKQITFLSANGYKDLDFELLPSYYRGKIVLGIKITGTQHGKNKTIKFIVDKQRKGKSFEYPLLMHTKNGYKPLGYKFSYGRQQHIAQTHRPKMEFFKTGALTEETADISNANVPTLPKFIAEVNTANGAAKNGNNVMFVTDNMTIIPPKKDINVNPNFEKSHTQLSKQDFEFNNDDFKQKEEKYYSNTDTKADFNQMAKNLIKKGSFIVTGSGYLGEFMQTSIRTIEAGENLTNCAGEFFSAAMFYALKKLSTSPESRKNWDEAVKDSLNTVKCNIANAARIPLEACDKLNGNINGGGFYNDAIDEKNLTSSKLKNSGLKTVRDISAIGLGFFGSLKKLLKKTVPHLADDGVEGITKLGDDEMGKIMGGTADDVAKAAAEKLAKGKKELIAKINSKKEKFLLYGQDYAKDGAIYYDIDIDPLSKINGAKNLDALKKVEQLLDDKVELAMSLNSYSHTGTGNWFPCNYPSKKQIQQISSLDELKKVQSLFKEKKDFANTILDFEYKLTINPEITKDRQLLNSLQDAMRGHKEDIAYELGKCTTDGNLKQIKKLWQTKQDDINKIWKGSISKTFDNFTDYRKHLIDKFENLDLQSEKIYNNIAPDAIEKIKQVKTLAEIKELDEVLQIKKELWEKVLFPKSSYPNVQRKITRFPLLTQEGKEELSVIIYSYDLKILKPIQKLYKAKRNVVDEIYSYVFTRCDGIQNLPKETDNIVLKAGQDFSKQIQECDKLADLEKIKSAWAKKQKELDKLFEKPKPKAVYKEKQVRPDTTAKKTKTLKPKKITKVEKMTFAMSEKIKNKFLPKDPAIVKSFDDWVKQLQSQLKKTSEIQKISARVEGVFEFAHNVLGKNSSAHTEFAGKIIEVLSSDAVMQGYISVADVAVDLRTIIANFSMAENFSNINIYVVSIKNKKLPGLDATTGKFVVEQTKDNLPVPTHPGIKAGVDKTIRR